MNRIGVRVIPNFEDLAGNHVGQAFDIDTFERVTKQISTNTVSLPFAVR